MYVLLLIFDSKLLLYLLILTRHYRNFRPIFKPMTHYLNISKLDLVSTKAQLFWSEKEEEDKIGRNRAIPNPNWVLA